MGQFIQFVSWTEVSWGKHVPTQELELVSLLTPIELIVPLQSSVVAGEEMKEIAFITPKFILATWFITSKSFDPIPHRLFRFGC